MDKRIDYEFRQIEKELEVINLLVKIIKTKKLDKIEIRAAASSLHSIYNGLEKIIVIDFKTRKNDLPNGSSWHSDTLDLFQREYEIDDALMERLREYMAFRHYYRHNYGFTLDVEMLKPLLINIELMVNDFKLFFID